jgi:hypothetical protein
LHKSPADSYFLFKKVCDGCNTCHNGDLFASNRCTLSLTLFLALTPCTAYVKVVELPSWRIKNRVWLVVFPELCICSTIMCHCVNFLLPLSAIKSKKTFTSQANKSVNKTSPISDYIGRRVTYFTIMKKMYFIVYRTYK